MKLSVAIVSGCMLMAIPLARGDDSRVVFDRLYSSRIQEAIKSPATADNVALARELLDAVPLAEKQGDFIKLLCNKAAELAFADPTAMDVVVDAQKLLAIKVPAQASAVAESLLEYRKAHYQRAVGQAKIEAAGALIADYIELADRAAVARNFVEAIAKTDAATAIATTLRLAVLPELRARQEQLKDRNATWQKMLTHQQTLARQPDAIPARNELVRLLTFEFNAPDEANKWVTDAVDAKSRELTPLAAQDAASVDIGTCAKLATWYAENSASVGKTAAPVCLDRAIAYQERYVGQSELTGLAKTQAELQLKQWRALRARMGGNAPLVVSGFGVPHKLGLIKQQKIEGMVGVLQFAPTGSIVVATLGNQLWAWNAAGDKTRTIRAPIAIAEFALSPDGKKVFFGGAHGKADFDARLWDVETDKQIGDALGGPGKLMDVLFDGEHPVAVINAGETIKLRTFAGHRPEITLALPGPVGEATFAADLTKGFLLGEARQILPCQPRAGNVSEAVDFKFRTNSLHMSANGRVLFMMSHAAARGFDVAGGKPLPMINWPEEGCKMVRASLSADGRRVALSAAFSGNAYVFDVTTGKQVAALTSKAKNATGSVSTISPDGRFALSSATGEGVVQLWGLPLP
ncbi:MAG: WD40 repeat domain-containing protein [Phycisphaerae bacterium]